MKIKCLFTSILFLAAHHGGTVHAFVPVASTTTTTGRLSTTTTQQPLLDKQSNTKTTSTLLNVPTPDTDLVVGFVTIAAATTPYTLSLFLPDFFNDNFFLPIYNNSTPALALAAREAEIGWKVRYATLALALTTLAFLEVTLYPNEPVVYLLRDSYWLWAAFYISASIKILREYKQGLLAGNRRFIQAWHLVVATILVLDTSTSPRAEAIIDFIKNIFTF